MTLPNLDPILNGNPADAILVNNNFTKLSTYVDADLINADGSVAMTQPLNLGSNTPTDPNHAVRLQDLTSGESAPGVPTGAILDFGGTTAPPNYLLCDGGLYSRVTYVDLFGVIGTAFTAPEYLSGSQFQVPDFGTRSAVGYDTGATGFQTIGTQGGSANAVVVSHTHTGTTAADGRHRHGYTDDTRGVDLTVTTQSSGLNTGYSSNLYTNNENTDYDPDHTHSFTTSDEGVSGVGANYHPTLVVNKIIKT